MHFFSPVHKMPLLEIIVTDKTNDLTTATCVAYGKRLNKQVIVVRDGVGFYTSRILAPYMTEATRVLYEGAAIDDIDRAMMDFGFPVGPIVLSDEVGIDVGAKVSVIMYEAYGERMKPVEALKVLLDDDRMGRKNKRGFYLYGEKKKKGKKQVDETIYDLLPGGRKRKPIDTEEVQKRIALGFVNEAMHCLGDGILRSPRDGDIGAIFGLGFPPFLGGPFRYVDIRGADKVLDDLKRLRDKFGPRFEPAPALADAARDNRKFRD
jgi:3-hydroxyacyl-CoA dehydrogenase/enoyl-CoA hydratase/3-hydroxybutyryl-CoA epimerase